MAGGRSVEGRWLAIHGDFPGNLHICMGMALTWAPQCDSLKEVMGKDITCDVLLPEGVVPMKKWHLEGVLGPIAPGKLTLPDPDPGQSAVLPFSTLREPRKESKLRIRCRVVAVFFIRFF